MDNTNLGAARDRLKVIEAKLNRIPPWARGSPRASRLIAEAKKPRDQIERVRLRRRWVVPQSEGPPGTI
jgi:hypothetical protein